jgi:hypothetical protein
MNSVHMVEFDTPAGNPCESESITLFFMNSCTIERGIEKFMKNNTSLLGAGARIKSRRRFADIEAAEREYEDSADGGWCWPPLKLTVFQ